MNCDGKLQGNETITQQIDRRNGQKMTATQARALLLLLCVSQSVSGRARDDDLLIEMIEQQTVSLVIFPSFLVVITDSFVLRIVKVCSR